MAVINKDYSNIKVGTTDLQRLYAGNTLIWELESPTPTPTGYSTQFLTLIALDSGTFQWTPGDGIDYGVQYSLDSGQTWSQKTDNSITVNVSSGDVVMWAGENHLGEIGTFSASTASFNVEGNALSLIWGKDDRLGNTEFPNRSGSLNRDFYRLFYHTKVVDASNLILQPTVCTQGCYYQMFTSCRLLSQAPQILATTMAQGCCEDMFDGCWALTTAPQLPATTLANDCYSHMFAACTHLTQAPELPATTLAQNCYGSMFSDCSALTTAPVLSATTLAASACSFMFSYCTSLTQAPELLATSLTNSCYSSMFRGCTALILSPELSATTLTPYCYNGMFYGCTNLNYIKMLATDISASMCLYNWVNGVGNRGTFFKNANTTIPSGNSGIPTGWTVQNE